MHAVLGRSDHLETLGGVVLEQGAVAAVESPAVGLDDAVDEALVQAVHGLDQGALVVLGMAAERHAGALPGDDLLHHHGHDAAPGVEPELPAVEQGRVGPERGPHELDVLEDRVDAAHVDVGLVEPGERGGGRVLAGRRGAHDGRRAGEARGERLRQRRAHLLRQRRGQEEAADPQRRVPQLLPAHVGEVLALELEADARAQPRRLQVRRVRVGGDGDERRHGDPRAGHARQRQRLAAHARGDVRIDPVLRDDEVGNGS